MSGFIEGENHHHPIVFPEALDVYVFEENPVRVVDLFNRQARYFRFGF